MTYGIVFAPEAGDQLAGLYGFIARAASASVALRFTETVVSYCESLRTFPYRGVQREDIRPGLRITHYKKRTVVAFAVDADLVSIIGVFYGGQDYEAILRDDAEREQSVED